uniref:Metalloproteinase inhibitor 2 n=1 Tax=Hucho hucho TaxID=62062 RepID=A0A4W5QHK2_9TELE
MTWSMSSCVITLFVLFLWRVEDIAEACSCSPAHPQQLNHVSLSFALLVIRAKVVGKKVVEAGNDVYGNTIKRIKYDIKQIKMFKGPDRDIDAIFTAPSSAVCGVTLETNGNEEYLFTGALETDGTMHVTLCDFIESWEAMSPTQKKSLTQRYESGCKCKVCVFDGNYSNITEGGAWNHCSSSVNHGYLQGNHVPSLLLGTKRASQARILLPVRLNLNQPFIGSSRTSRRAVQLL